MGKLPRHFGEDQPPVIRPRELPEPSPLDAEAHLDGLEVEDRQITTSGDAGAVEQREQLRRWGEQIERQGSEKLRVPARLHEYAIRNQQSAIRRRRYLRRDRRRSHANSHVGKTTRLHELDHVSRNGASIHPPSVRPDKAARIGRDARHAGQEHWRELSGGRRAGPPAWRPETDEAHDG